MTKQHFTTNLPQNGWASFYLVIKLIKTLWFVRANLSLMPEQFWLAMAVYITGLITQQPVSCNRYCRQYWDCLSRPVE